MNKTTLEALRRLLFFSQPEAARLIGGVSERSWRYWEEGQRTIPPEVKDRLAALLSWRNGILANPRHTRALVCYPDLDGWLSLPDSQEVLWRPHCSVVAELCAQSGAALIPFDAADFKKWRGDRKDTHELRDQWAAQQVS